MVWVLLALGAIAIAQGPAKHPKSSGVDLVKLVRNGDYHGMSVALDDGADPNGKPGKPPIWQAAQSGDLKAVKILLAHKADPNIESRLGTPMTAAVYSDRPEVVRTLIQAGANPNGDKKGHWHPICMATSVAVLRVLLDAHADIEAQQEEGLRPLHIACTSGNAGIANLLISSAAKVDAIDDAGNTPLMSLAFHSGFADSEDEKVKIAQHLVEAGANLQMKNEAGLTAYDMAKSHQLLRLAKYLVKVKPKE